MKICLPSSVGYEGLHGALDAHVDETLVGRPTRIDNITCIFKAVEYISFDTQPTSELVLICSWIGTPVCV